ncbi:TetR-like C-terminal domain-containing protein [Yinghuangia seranimata]|uniref:TetR-like C-terminal domain-containing protein n=1 Tax=Yinghuangia seranimata TaxID=408067 RepID=UPI00248C19A5|nr:TetR-like C-terminal domain-containing protein [Yinghuangia seranimata]MDI2131074.1 TetR-like C-terminal domain-containing protein [Yinghuangia seranimata]
MPPPPQRRGRPRDDRIDTAVLRTARELMDEVGYSALTVDAVAAAAGVSKTAIYRRFPSKAEMAFAAAVHDTELPAPPDTGTLRGDLRAMIRIIHGAMTAPAARALAPALMAELAKDPGTAERFQKSVLAAERAHFAAILGQAAARGEVREDVRADVAHLLLAGPVFYALFGFGLVVDTMLDAIADTVAAGLAEDGTPASG